MTMYARQDDAGEIRRILSDPRDLCARLGLLEASRPQGGGGVMIRCIAHEDRTPSCSVRRGRDGTVACKCHGCGWSGDALGLIAVAYGLDTRRDFPSILRHAADLAGMSLDDVRPRPFQPPTAQPNREYPKREEVDGIWQTSRPVIDDPEVCAWLTARGLSPSIIEERDLARTLAPETDVLSWATCSAQIIADDTEARTRIKWHDAGYKLLLPVFDSTGAMRSVRARRVVAGNGPKNLMPSGRSAGALVLADSFARVLLSDGQLPSWWPRGSVLRVVVAEGDPDFLTWGTRFSEADETAPAVFGVGSGMWTDAIATRIPAGTRVTVRTDADEAGDKYAAQVAASLNDRCVVLRAKGGAS